MELKAENTFTVTEELSREGTMCLMKDDYFPTVKKLLIAAGVAWVLLVGATVWRGSWLMAIAPTAVVIFLAVWLLVMNPRSRAKRNWKALRARLNDDLKRTTRFYEDRLEVESAGSQLIVNYEDIRRVLESEHLLILINDEKLGVMAALDGFTLGDKETVLELVNEWSR